LEVTPVVLHMSPRQKALDTGCFYRMVTTGLVNVSADVTLEPSSRQSNGSNKKKRARLTEAQGQRMAQCDLCKRDSFNMMESPGPVLCECGQVINLHNK
jgi:hypothetical protein